MILFPSRPLRRVAGRYFLASKVLRFLFRPITNQSWGKPPKTASAEVFVESPSLTELSSVAIAAARAGAKELLAWKGRFAAREKGVRDLVTDADLAAEQAIRQVISQAFPGHGFVGEESASAGQWDRPYCWVADPLDGTTNYVHGYPCYAVSIAVTAGDKLLAGVVLDPERNECFAAVVGGGATLNGQSIQSSGAKRVADSLLAVSLPAEVKPDSPDLARFLRLAPLCQAIRRTGSAALNLAYVACGRFDGHWAHEIHPWDSAAGMLLVQEAGGIATASNGMPYDVRKGNYLVAASTELHKELLGLILP